MSETGEKTKLTRAQLADELETIRRTNRGILRPEAVVNAAREDDHPLHDCFQWDDTEAAAAYRLWQARVLIRVTVRFLPGNDKRPVRAYVSLRSDRSDPGGGYRAVVDVLRDDELYAQMLDEALAELRYFQQKYRVLKELRPVFLALRKVKKKARTACSGRAR